MQNPRSDRQRAVNRSSQRITTPVRSKEHGMKIIRIVSIAGMSCLMVGPALAQSQNSPPQNPSQNPTQSQPGASTDRPVPADPTAPNRPLSSSRGNENVQSPRENQNVQSPRENQDVQSPRENQDVQSPRGKHMGAKHDSVRAGQAALKAQGFDPGKIDGVYGPSTHAALTNYQRSNGLRETGRFDNATLAKLGVGSTNR